MVFIYNSKLTFCQTNEIEQNKRSQTNCYWRYQNIKDANLFKTSKDKNTIVVLVLRFDPDNSFHSFQLLDFH